MYIWTFGDVCLSSLSLPAAIAATSLRLALFIYESPKQPTPKSVIPDPKCASVLAVRVWAAEGFDFSVLIPLEGSP